MIGDRYNHLEIIGDLGVHNKNRKVLCRCDCGLHKEIFLFNLKKNNTKSCGCLLKTHQKEKWENVYNERGYGKLDQETPEYLAWRNMNSRCYNEKDISYNKYGAKSIVVCDEWRFDFLQFFKDVGKRPSEKHSLDRFDVNKGYTKDNVFWKDYSWQARNKGKKDNCSSVYKGVSFESGKWRARIKDSSGQPVHLGMFNDEKQAAKSVDSFLRKEFGNCCPWTNEKLGLLSEEIRNE